MSNNTLGVNTIGVFKYDEIFAGSFPRVTCEVTATDGTMELRKGSILKLSSTGSTRMSAVMATLDDLTNPANNVFAVLGEDLEEDEVGIGYLTGEFIGDKMLISDGSGHLTPNWRSVRHNLFGRSLFLQEAELRD